MRVLGRTAIAALACGTALHAQSPAPAPQRFAAGTTAVLVDVVVTDAKGTPVSDLTREDFEVAEDGVAQTITGFTAPMMGVSASSDDGNPRRAAESQAVPRRIPTTHLALVFGRVTPEGRQLAYRAAMARIEDIGGAAGQVGIFAVDRAFLTIQAFTSDLDTIRAGVRRAGMRATKGPRGQSPGAEYGLPGELERLTLDDNPEAQIALFGLLKTVKTLAQVDGHKAVIYFTDTFTVEPGLEPYFQDLIELANRNNVTFYALDTAGLRTHSAQQAFGAMLNENANRALESGTGGDMATIENTATMLRSGNVPAILRVVSEETGGFAIVETNDLSAGVARIATDNRARYVLTYTPANANFNGEYRRLSVRVRRPGLLVRARPGYRAVPEAARGTVAAFEAPGLAALDQEPAPDQLPVRLAAFAFPLQGGRSIVPIVVQTPVRVLEMRQSGGRYEAGAVVVARIKDASGAVVAAGSTPFRFEAPAARRDEAAAVPVQYYRQTELGPGRYVVEASVVDAASHRAGVARTTLIVPEQARSVPEVSSLILVDRAEPRPKTDADAGDNPMLVNDRLVVPRADARISRTAQPETAFYFTVLPTGREPVQARLELLQEGHVIGRTALSMASVRDGRIQQMGRVPTGRLAPGSYEARVTVWERPTDVVQRTAVFEIVE